MATFTKIISGNDYCNGGASVYVPQGNQSFEDRCENSVANDIYDNRFDDERYYHKKTEARAFSGAFSSAFG